MIIDGIILSNDIRYPDTRRANVVTIQENKHNQVWKYAFWDIRAFASRLGTVRSKVEARRLKDGHVIIRITRLMSCNVFVKYLELLFYLRSGYLNFLIQAAKTNPNSHTFIAPPPVIAPIPHLQIPQLSAKKKT